MTKDYYRILGISYPSSPEEINNAYREMAKKWHPDHNPGKDVTGRMMDINEAAEILRDPIKKSRYDAEYKFAFGTQWSNSSRSDSYDNPDYDVKDDSLKEDIKTARKNAEEYVREFMSEFKTTGKSAAKGAWDFAKPFIIIFLVISICAPFCTGFIEGCSSNAANVPDIPIPQTKWGNDKGSVALMNDHKMIERWSANQWADTCPNHIPCFKRGNLVYGISFFFLQSGQSQFAPLKLRSLALVPSSGAQSAPTNSTYGSSTARLFLPRQSAPDTDSRPFRAALRALKEIRSRDCDRASRPQTLAGSSPQPPRAMNAREALYRRDHPCPESAKINIILSRLCHSSHQGSTTAKTASILVGQKPAQTGLPAAGEHNLDYVNFAPSVS